MTTWRVVFGIGVIIGVVYALSPLSVWFALAAFGLLRWVGRDLPERWARWARALLAMAIIARLAAVIGLFLFTDHATVPFGSFFGDEEYFIKRSIWLRNVALGIPIHGADLIYAFDEYSQTSYLYVLALSQVLVGPAPYGVHLFGIAVYLTATVLLFRLVGRTLGWMPALAGLLLLLFLPSLFAWSISALKEPLFFLMVVSTVLLTVRLVRGPGWGLRIVALVLLVAVIAAIDTVRTAGAALTAAAVGGGLIMAALVTRPKLVIAVAVLVPIVAGVALSRPLVQTKTYAAVQQAARQHWGHVATAGYTYRLLDERFYPDRSEIGDMRFPEVGRFVVRALAAYVTVPLPWKVQSRAALAYLPEQVVWYMLVLLAMPGLLFALRRDALVASILLGHTLVAALSVALTSGNVGTLVRHRGLALPYLVWLSAVGLCELVSRDDHGDS